MVLRVRHAQLAVGQRRDAARAVEAQTLTAAAAVGAQSQAVVLTTDGEAVLEDGTLAPARMPAGRDDEGDVDVDVDERAVDSCDARAVAASLSSCFSRLLGSGLLCLLTLLILQSQLPRSMQLRLILSAEQQRATCLSTEAASSCEITPAPPERWTCETGPRLRGDNSEEELGRAVSLPQ